MALLNHLTNCIGRRAALIRPVIAPLRLAHHNQALIQRRDTSARMSIFTGPGSEKLRELTCTLAGGCSSETPPVDPEQLPGLLAAVPFWKLREDGKALTRSFTAKNFMAAIAFFNKVAEVAEAEGHHPDLKLHNYRDVEITVSTHAAGALTYPDFVLASKLDALDVDYSPKWLQQYREKAASKTAQ